MGRILEISPRRTERRPGRAGLAMGRKAPASPSQSPHSSLSFSLYAHSAVGLSALCPNSKPATPAGRPRPGCRETACRERGSFGVPTRRCRAGRAHGCLPNTNTGLPSRRAAGGCSAGDRPSPASCRCGPGTGSGYRTTGRSTAGHLEANAPAFTSGQRGAGCSEAPRDAAESHPGRNPGPESPPGRRACAREHAPGPSGDLLSMQSHCPWRRLVTTRARGGGLTPRTESRSRWHCCPVCRLSPREREGVGHRGSQERGTERSPRAPGAQRVHGKWIIRSL